MENNNTGDQSAGYRSTGDCSTADRSTGDQSAGYRSTGDWSTGYFSTGYGSTGNFSTGYYSTGYGSTGDWSISSYSTGHFSTEDYAGFGAFNKPCTPDEWDNAYKPDWLYFNLTEWVATDNMSDQEKEDNPSYKTTDGYLKVYGYQEAFQKSYNEANREEQLKIKELPNFDADVFFTISGIRIDAETEEMPRQKK